MEAKPSSDVAVSRSADAVFDERLLTEISDRLGKELALDALDVRRVIEGHLSKFDPSNDRDEALRAFYVLLWSESELN